MMPRWEYYLCLLFMAAIGLAIGICLSD
jgi:hypothetical protein